MFVSIKPNYPELREALKNGFFSPEQLASLRETPEKLSEVITHWLYPYSGVIPVKVGVVSSKKEDGVTHITFRKMPTGTYVDNSPLYNITIYDLPWYERLYKYIKSTFEETHMDTYCVENTEKTNQVIRVTYDAPDPDYQDEIGYLRLEVSSYRTEFKKEEKIRNLIVLRGLTPEAETPENVIQLFKAINVDIEGV